MLTITLRGRLGNQLYEYAMVRSIAEKNGYGYYIIPEEWNGTDLFDLDFGKIDTVPMIYTYTEKYMIPYDPLIWEVKDGTCFQGYFQTEKYFDQEKVRKWFKLKPSMESDQLILKYPIEEYCYIHLRGGDFNLIPDYSYSLPREYFYRAIKKINEEKSISKFIVITDDVKYGHECFPQYEILNNNILTDFNLINKAKYLIISNSSFAWWATWLNENNYVIAPKGGLDARQRLHDEYTTIREVKRFIYL